ncbi:hypothetical protein CCACVL1_00130, partial [Corchorus capsularis]
CKYRPMSHLVLFVKLDQECWMKKKVAHFLQEIKEFL